jgi:hypothetical protein
MYALILGALCLYTFVLPAVASPHHDNTQDTQTYTHSHAFLKPICTHTDMHTHTYHHNSREQLLHSHSDGDATSSRQYYRQADRGENQTDGQKSLHPVACVLRLPKFSAKSRGTESHARQHSNWHARKPRNRELHVRTTGQRADRVSRGIPGPASRICHTCTQGDVPCIHAQNVFRIRHASQRRWQW